MSNFIANNHIKSQKDLEDLLEGYGIDTSTWGKKGFKGMNHLYTEILDKESIIEVANNKLIRHATIVLVNIYFEIEALKTKFKLREALEIFKKEDGTLDPKRLQRQQAAGSIGEKVKANVQGGELNVENEIYRALFEELEIKRSHGAVNMRNFVQTYESKSFPGLATEYTFHEADIYLSTSEYVPEGYVLEQEDRVVVFEWVLV